MVTWGSIINTEVSWGSGLWNGVGGGHQEDMTTCWPMSSTLQRLLIPSSILGMCIPLAFLTPEGVSRTRLWDSDMVLRSSDSTHDWAQLKPPYTLHIHIWWAGAETYLSSSYPRQLSYVNSLAIATYQSGVSRLILQSLHDLHIQEPVSVYTWHVYKPTNGFSYIKGDEERSRVSRPTWSKTIYKPLKNPRLWWHKADKNSHILL